MSSFCPSGLSPRVKALELSLRQVIVIFHLYLFYSNGASDDCQLQIATNL